jgi:hypothetical protein
VTASCVGQSLLRSDFLSNAGEWFHPDSNKIPVVICEFRLVEGKCGTVRFCPLPSLAVRLRVLSDCLFPPNPATVSVDDIRRH